MLICLDFDGVLHRFDRYSEMDDVPGTPTEGSLEFCNRMAHYGNTLIIHSCRANSLGGKIAIARWLRKYGFPEMEIASDGKPIAHVYIDDRGMRFNGNWKEIEEALSRGDDIPWYARR